MGRSFVQIDRLVRQIINRSNGFPPRRARAIHRVRSQRPAGTQTVRRAANHQAALIPHQAAHQVVRLLSRNEPPSRVEQPRRYEPTANTRIPRHRASPPLRAVSVRLRHRRARTLRHVKAHRQSRNQNPIVPLRPFTAKSRSLNSSLAKEKRAQLRARFFFAVFYLDAFTRSWSRCAISPGAVQNANSISRSISSL